jgi:hypothetical protein
VSALAIAAFVEAAWGLALLPLFGYVWARREKRRRKAESDIAIRPAIEEILTIYVTGGNCIPELKELRRANRPQMERSILKFQAVAGFRNSERLGDLVLDLAIAHDWIADAQSRDFRKKRRAFSDLCAFTQYEKVMRIARDALESGSKDADEFVRLKAVRALARSSEIEDVAKALRQSVSGSRKLRALISPELRREAVGLCEAVIPELLGSDNTQVVASLLEMLASWRCALPLESVSNLAENQDRGIRLKTMRLLPMLPVTHQNRDSILRGLCDEDAEVRAAAADAARFLKIQIPSPGKGEQEPLAERPIRAVSKIENGPSSSWVEALGEPVEGSR